MARYVVDRYDPILRYDSGHPTRLVMSPRLGALIQEHGEPDKIERRPPGWMLSWWPLYPGLPVQEYLIAGDPWNDGRKLVRVSCETVWKERA